MKIPFRFSFSVLACTVFVALVIGCAGQNIASIQSEDQKSIVPERASPLTVKVKGEVEQDIDECEAQSHSESVLTAVHRLEYPEDGVFDSRETFKIELREASLDRALDFIAKQGNVNVLFKGRFDDPVEFTWPEVRLDDAFRTLLTHYECLMACKEGVYVVSRMDRGAPVSHIFPLRSAAGVDILSNIAAIVGSGSEPVLSPEGNTLMVTASQATLEAVAAFLDSVDVPEKQVLIEAKIIEDVVEDLLELGTELKFNNIHMDDISSQILSSFLPESDDATLLVAGDNADIEGSINVLKQLTNVEILSRPRIFAKNGKEAKIEVIEEVPYVKSTATTTGTSDGVGTSTVEEVEFKEVGLKLTVTPYIKGNNSVELKILQDASEQMGTYLDVPVVDHRLVDTTFVVDDGKTVMMGGLIKSETRDEVKGIPILMDIPLLGHLFKSTKEVTQKRELMILLRPRVVQAGSAEVSTEGYTDPIFEKEAKT